MSGDGLVGIEWGWVLVAAVVGVRVEWGWVKGVGGVGTHHS